MPRGAYTPVYHICSAFLLRAIGAFRLFYYPAGCILPDGIAGLADGAEKPSPRIILPAVFLCVHEFLCICRFCQVYRRKTGGHLEKSGEGAKNID